MNLKSNKIILILGLLVVFLMTAVVGCDKQETKAPSQTPTPAAKELKLATTTSTRDSGLLDFLLPAFEKDTNYKDFYYDFIIASDGQLKIILAHSFRKLTGKTAAKKYLHFHDLPAKLEVKRCFV